MSSGEPGAFQRLPIDSHRHIRLPDGSSLNHQETVEGVVSATRTLFQGACYCSTAPSSDWDLVDTILTSSSSAQSTQTAESTFAIGGGFGVHPWWVTDDGLVVPSATIDKQQRDGDEEPWVVDLKARLQKHPSAIVGEIGLDKLKNSENFTRQVEVFHKQLDIAAEFGRPVSIHCVRAWGPMLDAFTKRGKGTPLPPTVIFHGFNGSLDFVKSLQKNIPKKMRPRFYFGIGANTTLMLKNAIGLVAGLPEDSLLVESDQFEDEDAVTMVGKAMQLLVEAHQVRVEGNTMADGEQGCLMSSVEATVNANARSAIAVFDSCEL